MNKVGFFAASLLCVGQAFAAAPAYDDDPFGDDDFEGTPMILDVAHPSKGRAEVGLMFSSTVIDKYNSHLGGMADVTYHLSETLGANLALGFLHGAMTPIVTDEEGIIGNKLSSDACTQAGGNCDLNPNVPDFDQITGIVTASLLWAPLYGKINLVSELDVNLQLYGLLGLGANGTRRVQVQRVGSTFQTAGSGLGEGGMLGGTKVHGSIGGGLKVFAADWADLRVEFRDIIFADQFDFNDDGTEDSYLSHHYLFQVGLGFILF